MGFFSNRLQNYKKINASQGVEKKQVKKISRLKHSPPAGVQKNVII
jgi:hypothetical protein